MRNLKIILVTASLLLFGAPARSQSDTAQKRPKHKGVFETGVNLYGLTLRPGNFYTRYKTISDQQFFSGLYLKYYKGMNALRWELNYSQRNLHFGKDPFNNYFRSGIPTKSLEIKMGYQRSFGRRKLSLYCFADLEYNYFWSPFRYGNYPLYNDYYDPSFNYYYGNSAIVSGSFFCLSPGLGLRWKLGKHLVLNAETTAQFFYARQRPVYYKANNKADESIGINAKPIRLSIGFIF